MQEHDIINNNMVESQDVPSNSALNVKLDYIQRDINEIKIDIKEIKQDYVSRREFTDALTTIREEISPLRKILYGTLGVLGIATLSAIFKLIFK